MYSDKIAIIVDNELMTWQKLNVVAFLASAVAIEHPTTHGSKFIDASNIEYMAFLKNPIMIYKSENSEEISKAYTRARERELSIGIYTRPLFATKNEEQNHQEIGKLPEHMQDLVGLVFYGDRKQVDKATKGLKLHE